jgi:hypothetical protein
LLPFSPEPSVFPSVVKNLKTRIYKTIILPVIVYWCETWSLTLREQHRLRVFENRMVMRIFGSKRDEVTGEWRKLHNEELRDLYFLPITIRTMKSRRMRWVGHVTRRGEKRKYVEVIVGKARGKGPLERLRRRRMNNIKKDLLKLAWGGVDWIGLAQDRDKWKALVNAVMNLLVP